MALSSTDAVSEIAQALAIPAKHSKFILDKASIGNAVAGQVFSLWRATGVPGQGAIPTTAAVCTSALTGAIPFTNQTAPIEIYHAYQVIAAGNTAAGLEFHDRLAHMGGLSGTVTTAQGALTLAGVSADRIGPTNYSAVSWWLEWYTDTGATNVNATVNVTYDDDSTGNLAVIALGVTARAGRMFPLIPLTAGRNIKAVNSVTLSATTGAAGNFGITATDTSAASRLLLPTYCQSLIKQARSGKVE